MSTRALYALTLAEGVTDIAAGRVTASALADAQLARIAATEAAIEAWETLDPAFVRAQARRCDDAKGGGLLAGAGIGVKDIIDTHDLPTTQGSPIFAGRQPAQDAPCIARMRAAGGFVFGKTVTTPFAFMDPGKSRNPWDPAYSPGGSSSGSAAAVAAGHVAAAIGTQTNGSVVRPAAYCGVVGFKPTVNAIPVAGVHEFSVTLDVVGTFGRRVEDAARLASVIADAGRIAAQIAPLPAAPRLGFLPAFPWVRHDPDASAVVATAVARLRGHAEIVPLAIPEPWHQANLLLRTIMLHEAGVALAGLQARERARLTPALNAALDEGRAIPVAAYRAALAQRDDAIAFFTDWLSGFDAVLSPSAPGTAPFGLGTTGDPACCTLWSLLGFPALNLPCGKLGRMPIGLQFAAPQGCDNRLLSVASLGEQRVPFEGLV